MRTSHVLSAAGAAIARATSVPAQGVRTDCARARQLLAWNASKLVDEDAVRPRWMRGDRFWHHNLGGAGEAPPAGYEIAQAR